MSFSDPLGDMLTRIRNAQMRGMDKVVTPASKLRARVLDVLQQEGYIRGFVEVEKDGHRQIEIELKYFEGTPVISEIRRVSKPGRRVYSSRSDIPLVRNGLGISILSTSKGVMSDNMARDENVGGEIMEAVMWRMNLYGRMPLCGMISGYNSTEPMKADFTPILMKRINIQGFIVIDFLEKFPEATIQLATWVAEGKIKSRETIVDGLENAASAVNMLFDGKNMGKLVVKVAEPETV